MGWEGQKPRHETDPFLITKNPSVPTTIHNPARLSFARSSGATTELVPCGTAPLFSLYVRTHSMIYQYSSIYLMEYSYVPPFFFFFSLRLVQFPLGVLRLMLLLPLLPRNTRQHKSCMAAPTTKPATAGGATVRRNTDSKRGQIARHGHTNNNITLVYIPVPV